MTKKEKEAIMKELQEHSFWCTAMAIDGNKPHTEPVLAVGYTDLNNTLDKYTIWDDT